MMISDEELVSGITHFLLSSDLNKTTVSIVRRRLEVDFGIDLSGRKPFLRRQVSIFLYRNVKEKSLPREPLPPPPGSDSHSDPSKGSGRKVNKDEEKTGVIRSKSCSLSAQLQRFLGETQMLRFEVLNRLWDYVSERNLIDPDDKQNILCDEGLQQLFGVDSFKVFQMNTLLSKHLSAVVKPSQKKKPRNDMQSVGDETEQNSGDLKRQKRVVTSGFLAPSPISPSFIRFLGTGECELTRPDAIRKVWDYIKEHKLQDPLNKRTILCDEKLKDLFEVDSFNGFTVSRLLKAHFVKSDMKASLGPYPSP